MDLGFSDEQKVLAKTAREFAKRHVPKTLVRDMEKDPRGFTLEMWNEMAALGWLAWVIPEEYGGVGGSFLDLAVLLEEMGRACVPGPFFSTVVSGGMTILEAGTSEQKERLLPQIAKGKITLALALLERSGKLSPEGIAVTAAGDGDDYIVNGTKLFVSDANAADYLICVARKKDSVSENGITLFLVDAKSSGINRIPLETIACDRQSAVTFDNVRVPRGNIIGKLGHGWDEVKRIIDRSAVGKCAEMVGGASEVLDMTVAFTQNRTQFGQLIGRFQAVQHHCANMATDVDGSRFITYEAAWMLSQGIPCTKEVAMAKAWVSDACRRVVTTAHQVHGAIGFTKDHDLQLYTRRAKAAELAFGDSNFYRERILAQWGI